MFRKFKPSKRQAPESGEITILNHTDIYRKEWINSEFIQIISMDPATINFAIRCEKRFLDTGKVETILFDKVNFTTEEKIEGNNVGPVDVNLLYLNITKYLDTHIELFRNSHYIIMERQPPMNYKTVKIGQHIMSYCLLACQNSKTCPIIIEINPFLKSIMFGIPRGIKQKDLKKLCTELAIEILNKREDQKSLLVLEKFKKKKDDLCDTIMQLEAFLKYKNPIDFLIKKVVKPKVNIIFT